MFYNFVAISILGVFEALLAVIVYLHDRRSRVNQLFTLFTFAIVTWTVSNFLADFYQSHFWTSATYFGALGIFYVLLLFVEAFPERTVPLRPYVRRTFDFLAILLTVAIFAPGGLIVGDVLPYAGGVNVVLGPFFSALALFYVVTLLYAFSILVMKYRLLVGLPKLQLQYISFGLGLSFTIGLLANLILPAVTGNYQISQYGPYGLVFFLVLTTFAIIRYNLLNITVIATEVFVVLLIFILLGQVFLADSATQVIGSFIVLLLASVLAYFLIRSMLREVRQREVLTKLTIQLEDANQQLKVLDEAKSEFVSIASHQLRTPLTVIKGYVSMLTEGSFGKIPTKQVDPIKKIYESANRLIELVENLLSISRIESGRMKYNMAPTKLEELAASATEELQTAAGNKKLKLTFEQPKEPLPELQLDGEKLRQVMMNLIDNAVKYTPKGSVTVRVEVVRDKRPPYITVPSVMFSVTDTGAGLTSEDQKRLFQKFNRADGNNLNTRGTGLGLYVGRMMVEAHHGVIWVTSPGVNKGSTFAFAVPLPSVTEEAILALKDMVR